MLKKINGKGVLIKEILELCYKVISNNKKSMNSYFPYYNIGAIKCYFWYIKEIAISGIIRNNENTSLLLSLPKISMLDFSAPFS